MFSISIQNQTSYMHCGTIIYSLLFHSPNELGETTLDAMFMDA